MTMVENQDLESNPSSEESRGGVIEHQENEGGRVNLMAELDAEAGVAVETVRNDESEDDDGVDPSM